MKKILLYITSAVMILVAAVLASFSPDILSLMMVGVMAVILILCFVFGYIPLIQYCGAFSTAIGNIHRVKAAQPENPWLAVLQLPGFFGQNMLDTLFDGYKSKVQQQRKNGVVIGNLDEVIHEDTLALGSWQGVMQQIPGTLTGIGLLGTFVGLITGINDIEFSSVDMALTSIQSLLSGIEVAFYTSIAGVILSILFNISYKTVWNMTIREYGVFLEEFHRNIIPSEEEQNRYRQKKDMQMILERLDRIPKNGGFSLAKGNDGSGSHVGNESILMPQIRAGLRNGEFTFYLQPRYDLNTHKIIGAEALVRWNHKKLGLVSPSVFIPTLEANGFITKLDQYIWEQVCITIRRWIDAGLRPVPISVNISKTDIMAIEISDFFMEMIHKYKLPPRSLDVEIAENAYVRTRHTAVDVETVMRQKGFRVIIDGFTGDYMSLLNIEESIRADAMKLDLRFMAEKKGNRAIQSILEQASKMKINVIAEGIENMEQMTVLRKYGCTEGQGFYLSKPMSIEDFEKELTRNEP